MNVLRVRLWECLFGIGLLSPGLVLGQQNPASAAARSWRETHEGAILREFMNLLAIPNIARDDANIHKNADAIVKLLERRGVKTQLLELPGVPPVVFGEITTPGATRTLVFYAHYDGQPLDPKEWATPPWQPVLRDGALNHDSRVVPLPANGPINPEWRLYARSASDDKAPVIAMRYERHGFHCALTSNWFSKARRKQARPTWPALSKSTKGCSVPTSG